MKEWLNSVLASGVTSALVSGLLGGAAGWLTASYKIEKEFHIRQAESGYEALVKANRLKWRAEEPEPYPDRAHEVAELKKESDDSYVVARHNIAAFGDERIVKALSDYWSKYGGAARSCPDKEKFAIRRYTWPFAIPWAFAAA
jgi:hypothetical protein